MSYNSLQQFIEALDEAGELIRVKEFVSHDLEITEISDRIMKTEGGGKALLFENNGTEFPILINAFGSDKRMEIALSCNSLDEIGARIDHIFKDMVSPKANLLDKIKMLPTLGKVASWLPKKLSGRGASQEVVMDAPDLSKIPVLNCWPADGGPFITLPTVITQDPNTGVRNVGMYRMQVMGKAETGMHWHRHKTGERHYQEYKARGEKMPIAVVLGGDPAYTFSATAPLPDNIDEYLLAGFLRNKKVELVKCLTNDIYVPNDADFIIEGYVDPAEEKVWEGPFGDHTGFYSLADWYPKLHVTAITHRKDAVYPATIVGIPPMEDAYIQRASERIFLTPMKLVMVPEIVDMDLPPSGVAHNLTVAQIEKTFPGQAQKTAAAMWGAGQMMFNKTLIVVEPGLDIHDYSTLAKHLSSQVQVDRDVFFSKGPMDVLDHSSSTFAFGSKMGIDATNKMQEELVYSSPESLLEKVTLDLQAMKNVAPEVLDVNVDLYNMGISVALIEVEKEKATDLSGLKEAIVTNASFAPFKCIAIVDKGVKLTDWDFVSWYTAGNIDPLRDCSIHPSFAEGMPSRIVMDGTRKTATHNNFKRDWPNPVVSSKETIAKVDERWEQYKIGEFVSSPSHRFVGLQRGLGAVAEE